MSAQQFDNAKNSFVGTITAASLLLGVLTNPQQASAASGTAAQISLNSIPPSSVRIDIKDVPIVGDAISGTYTRVDDKEVKSPSVSVKSPRDKVGAIKAVATGGHLEFDVSGLLATHLDVDVAADEAGVATVRVNSPLIPKLPFKNSANMGTSGGGEVGTKGRSSDWYKVTNLGDGDVYYFNSKTDETRADAPKRI